MGRYHYDSKGNYIGYSEDLQEEVREYERKEKERISKAGAPYDLDNSSTDRMLYFVSSLRWVVFEVIVVLSLLPYMRNRPRAFSSSCEVFFTLLLFFFLPFCFILHGWMEKILYNESKQDKITKTWFYKVITKLIFIIPIVVFFCLPLIFG